MKNNKKALVPMKKAASSYNPDKHLRPMDIFTNFFEIKFENNDIFKYAAEIEPDVVDARERMSIVSLALRRHSTLIREKFGDGYVFNNFAIYSKKTVFKQELKVTFDEQEYTISCKNFFLFKYIYIFIFKEN